MENVDQDAHTTGETKRRDMTGHMHSRSPSSSSVSLFFFYLSLLYRDFFFCSPLPLSGCFFEGLPPIGREIVQTPAGGTKSGISRGRIETEIFLFSTFNFQWHATSEEKKNKFFSRYLRRDRKWITFLSERKFSEKKKSRMPSGGSTLLLPSDQKSAKKKRESQSKKEKKKGKVNIWNKTRHCA